MRRLLLTLLFAITAAAGSAQVFPITLPSHVIVDSCSGCGGGTVAIDQTTPGTTNGIVVNNVPHVVCDSGCGSAASVLMADGVANPTIPQTASFGVVFNGTTWDRWRGDTTSGAWVNVKNTPAVTVSSGSITANAGTNLNTSALALDATVTGRLPAGASPADNESNTTTSLSRIGGFNFIFDGATWDRWTGAVSQSGAWTVTTTPPSNASTNVAQLAGTATSVNSGVKDAGTLRVVLATDQPQLTNKLLVTPDANSAVNLAQVGGTTVVNGGLAGSQSIGGTAGNNAAITQNPLVIGLEARSSTPTAATNGNQIRSAGDLAGNQFNVLPIAWSCNLQALAASLTQCQAAPAAGYSLYITAIIATTTTTTAGTFAIRYGTGTNCATTPIGVWPQPGGTAPSRVTTAPISTAAPMVINLGPVGIKLAAANAVCVIGTATNTIDIVLSGYTAP
jgi:hypothetical protein